MENPVNNQLISQVEAVISSINGNCAELQLAGSYETFQWPLNMLDRDIQVGEKILLELKDHPVTAIQQVLEKEKSKKGNKDLDQQRKLLESLIN